jgi:hypothetical protein
MAESRGGRRVTALPVQWLAYTNEERNAVSITDIIPDIHGQAEKLRLALQNLGWRRNGTTWLHPEPDRQIVFLGDFIDRGPENGAVVRIVRELMDSGRAQAIMGNHELNAIHFHATDPDTGKPLRKHSEENFKQHDSFLKEFPLGAPHTKDVLDWMRGLPLFLEADGFRAVHAAWIQSAIDDLRRQTGAGILSQDQLILAGRKGEPLYDLAEAVAKGPEALLPHPHSFEDKGGRVRQHVRVKWWNGDAQNWRQVAMSVRDINQIPDQPLSEDLVTSIYPVDGKPVFFGHYWMSGEPELQSANALCLDYSAGTDGPLVTYTHVAGSRELSLANVVIHK